MATKKDNQSPNLVLGSVTDAQSRALPNLIVRVYDRDMRSEELRAETQTDREGKYEITWCLHQLEGRGRGNADIAVKVLTKEKGTRWLQVYFHPPVNE